MVRQVTENRSARRTALTLGLLVALSASAKAQISVTPIDFSLDPAGNRVGAFTVSNDTPSPQQITLYANDWDRDEDGNNRFYPLGTLANSCKGRIQIFPQNTRLAPKASTSIRVGLLPSDTSRTGCWTIVFAETAPAAGRAGTKLAFVTRIGVKVYVTGQATAGLDATIDSMSVIPGTERDSAKRDVSVVLHNTGGQALTARGTLEFRTLDNAVAAKASVDDTPVLPGALRRIRIPVPANLAPGKYIALVVLSYGGSDDVAGQVEVDVP
jgi:P pilus assembly chaperone PapD